MLSIIVTIAKYHTYGWYLSRTRISQISRIYFFAASNGYSHLVLMEKLRRSQRSVRSVWEKFNIQHSTFNIITTSMDLRSYTKQELALLYFPDSDPDVARAHLMRWIVRCTQLYEQLLKSGYNKRCKEFNPLQVSYIFFHLGEP